MKKITRGCLIFLFCSNVFAASANDTKAADLKNIDEKIAQMKQVIVVENGKKGAMAGKLKSNKARLKSLEAQQAALRKKLQKQQVSISQLKQEQDTYNQQIGLQQDLLMKQVGAAYHLYREEQTLGFNQQDVFEQDQRFLAYCKDINVASVAAINESQQAISGLTTEKSKAVSHQASIQNALLIQQLSDVKLQTAAQNQQQVIQQLDSQIASKKTELNQLLVNREALENLVKKLQIKTSVVIKPSSNPPVQASSKATNQVTLPTSNVSFDKLRGELPWPLKGKITAQFGSSVAQSELKYTGVLIEPTCCDSVGAVAGGKVIFANWLQGLGLLIIIDHGDGYFTLYGHNHLLYKKEGDTVKPGEIIAEIGKNGKNTTNQLYFEVRHNGQPINPMAWCKTNLTGTV